MSHRKSDLGIPRPRKSAKVVLGSRLIKSTIQEWRRDKQRRDSCAPVCRTRGDSHEVLEPVEGALDAPAKFVQTLAEAEWLFPIAAVRDHRLGSLLIQFLTQFGTVVGFVAEHALGGLHPADEALCDRAVVRLTASQEDREESRKIIGLRRRIRAQPSDEAPQHRRVVQPGVQ